MMEEWQQRDALVDELADLDIKRERLKAFLGGEYCQALDDDARLLMLAQESVMDRLSGILQRRIERWGDE